MKGHIPWNKGLTKSMDERIRNSAEKMVLTKKSRVYPKKERKKGRIPWNKGLTKEIDSRIKGKSCTELTKRKISRTLKGHKHTEKSKRKMSKSHSKTWQSKTKKEREEWRQKNREGNLGKKQTEKTKKKIQKSALNQWKVKREKMLNALHTSRNKKPNNFEKNFLKHCRNVGLTLVEYVGDGSFWITVPKEVQKENRAINPDFVVTPFSETKTVIETMGVHWHSPENIQKREQIYQKAKINCIIITDEEFYNYPEIVNQKLEQLGAKCI